MANAEISVRVVTAEDWPVIEALFRPRGAKGRSIYVLRPPRRRSAPTRSGQRRTRTP